MLEALEVSITDFTDAVGRLDAEVIDVLPGLLVTAFAHRVLGLVFVVKMLPKLN